MLTLKDYQQTIGTGLDSGTYTVKTAGLYSVSAFSTLVPPSDLTITFNLNGSPVGPSSAQPSSGEINMQAFIPCQVGDVITVVAASSLDPQALVTIKTIFNLYRVA